MVTQYPDSITITVTGEPTQDSVSGFGAASTESTDYTFQCRAEKNTKGFFIRGVDGSQIDYAFVIYMPRTATNLPIGSKYVLTKGTEQYAGRIKDANNGQLNSMIWL